MDKTPAVFNELLAFSFHERIFTLITPFFNQLMQINTFFIEFLPYFLSGCFAVTKFDQYPSSLTVKIEYGTLYVVHHLILITLF